MSSDLKLLSVIIGGEASKPTQFCECAAACRVVAEEGEEISQIDLKREVGSGTNINSHMLKSTVHYLRMVASGADSADPGAPLVTTIYVDNSFVVNGFNRWRKTWEMNGWTTKAGTPVKMRDQWEDFALLVTKLNAQVVHCYGERSSPDPTENNMAAVKQSAKKLVACMSADLEEEMVELSDIPQVATVRRESAKPAPPPMLAGQGMW